MLFYYHGVLFGPRSSQQWILPDFNLCIFGFLYVCDWAQEEGTEDATRAGPVSALPLPVASPEDGPAPGSLCPAHVCRMNE